MANVNHLSLLTEGTIFWNAWIDENLEGRVIPYQLEPCLGCVDLSEADLSRMNLSGANLSKVDLSGANLSGTDLSGANLSGADLSMTNLSEANLVDADITGAKCNNTRLDYTLLINLDIKPLVMAKGVRHGGPSTVDHSAIARSLMPENALLDFLVATGMPMTYATYAIDSMMSLDPEGLFKLMQRTFISYGRPDEAFAEKLNQILKENGVRTYLYSHDAEWGAQHHRHLRAKINEHDRVLIICSQNSLTRKGVIDEIKKTLARETREGHDELLLPVTIDNFVFDEWDPEDKLMRQAILDRVVGDLRWADNDQTVLTVQLPRLLKALRKA